METREDDSPSEMMLANATLPTQSFLIESDDDEFLRRSDSRLSDVSTNSSKSEFPLGGIFIDFFLIEFSILRTNKPQATR